MRIIVGMSGGVDSSVTALLLRQQGFEVEGLFMKNWEEDDTEEYCSAAQDVADAQAVCDKLGIHLHRVNFASEYWDNVFSHFLEEYKAGRTPNPDILCNREIKFKAFLDYAKSLGADAIATGHYARKIVVDGQAQLHKAVDSNKDQSYFLHALTEHQLTHALFPLGELTKPEVRKIATEAGLVTHAKKDSTGICFIGERRFKDFLATYLPAQPGDIVTLEGKIIGQHDGLMYHTIGQRQGLKIGGTKNSSGEPWFVARKDLANNQLVVVQGIDSPELFQSQLRANKVHWINDVSLPITCTAKTRYRQADQECAVIEENGGISVTFSAKQRAITPGQSVVFYNGSHCLGGGVIV
jgi:tRNA-specific 2-thiouridylase